MTCCKGQACGQQCQKCEPLVWPLLDMPAPKHCDKSRQPCATPWECSPACRLIQANSDGSSDGITMESNLADRHGRKLFAVGALLAVLFAWAVVNFLAQ